MAMMRRRAPGWLPWLALALGLFQAAGARAQVVELSQAEFVLSDAERPPGDHAAWQRQALPDRWRASRPTAGDSGWYRIRFQAPASDDPLQAVYLPKLGLNAALFLNSMPIGDGGPFSEPIARNWNRPLIFLIPPGLLRPGANTLHIRLRAHPYTQAFLHPVFVGPEAELREVFERAHFLRITLNQTATLLIAAIGVLMLSLWWQRRQDTAYAYFGISALVWAAQSTNLYLRQVPLSTFHWEILVNGSFQVFSGFLLISLLRFSAAGGRPLIPALWFSTLAGPLSMGLAPAPYFLSVTTFWHFYTLVGTVATLLLLMRAAFMWHNRDARFLVGAMGLVVLFATHDWLMHSRHLWFGKMHWPLDDVYLLHYSAPLVFLAVGLVMTGRFVRVLNEFEQLNDELESRVQLKHGQLQESFTRMRALETEQAVAEERERIYRDLHDDVGAKLLSLVYRAGTPENAELARSALQELRDVVSTTRAENLSLSAACADWRAECEQRLAEAGIALDWGQSGELEGIQLTQPQALNLGRVLREALSNLIKHAQAGQANIHIEARQGALTLTIRDDGIGCNPEQARNGGRGLRNMEMRASRIGADFTRQTRPEGGCEIRLRLSLAG